mgnify:FL=1
MTPGLCECGCGGYTGIIAKTSSAKGHVAGQRYRFLRGHWAKTETGREASSIREYREARSAHGDGYVTVRGLTRGAPSVLEHRLIAEKVLGHPLPAGAMPHHINGKRGDNVNGNFVICQDSSYHRLLHRRQLALVICGHANWRKCAFCGKYDDPANLYIPPKVGAVEHRACGREYRRKRILRLSAERRGNAYRTEIAVS